MTLTDIANIALEDIGAKPIGNIDGDDVMERKLKRRIYCSIDTVSKRRNWVCLRREISLTRRVGMSASGEYSFVAPKGMLNIMRSSYPYRREGDNLYSADENLRVQCTVVSYLPSEWSINLRNAVIAQLKRDIVAPISGDPNLAAQVYQISEREIQEAMLSDSYDEQERRVQRHTTWFDEMP